jgi:hypothetical protein
MYVHLAPEKVMQSIRRTGIRPSATVAGLPSGVFAMPVVPNFYVSHQWLRELKASGSRTIVGVCFRVPDDERVWVGHFNQNHQEMSASQAAGLIMHAEKPEGFEIIVPRKIKASEIHRIRHLPQVLGWRYYPGAHGNPPCGCPFCQRAGRPGSRRLRERYESE